MDPRDLHISHLYHQPVDRVWSAWTIPDQVAQWWGPDGFTTTIHVMDVRAQGEWKLTLHGPDGTNFPNRSVYEEVVPGQKISFEHFNPHFFTTVLFEARGQDTQLSWTMRFDTAEMRDTVVKAHKADEGLKQNIRRLEQFLNGNHE